MQQHLMQMQPMMGGYSPNNITTDVIQKYLDENKQLILAILDNQNLGKLSECAHFQARLQQNLMYLAAIADAQPQPPAMHAQFPANAVMQPGAHYLQHQQAQALTPQSLMGARSPMMYAQQSLSALQQQQALHSQLGVSPSGNNGLHMLHGEANLGPSGQIPSGSFPDFGRSSAGSGEGIQSAGRATTMEQRGAGKQDVTGRDVSASGSADVRGGTAGAQAGDGTEPLYLKGPEGDGN
ncbi:GRF-interacting factor 1 [Nymphaea colorata]|nr:GRF-interacting factor 1 [Nymphaea colorata]